MDKRQLKLMIDLTGLYDFVPTFDEYEEVYRKEIKEELPQYTEEEVLEVLSKYESYSFEDVVSIILEDYFEE